ncbi:MAG: hypothetical protein BGO21_24280 [Dyadobacter sp. 50-39]|uniref:hypothetical protein n=1 Tax=Dyadobacter sp. 50-39 TaxID=1895756 RepID=UPI00095C70F1|nr:hypothetical protein [Dyadobacter sp. 50-39]OJV18648.1 MAG: hypothetical protein BGO21_24280 [Dyadobacter sp. 50-39]
MYTPTTSESPDSSHLACYGQLVQDLLSQTSPEEWIGDLWSIYSGYMAFEKEAGYNPRCTEIFETFRELVFFFQKAEKLSM